MGRLQSLLLIGPTGSGKTPLGEHLESAGLWGLGCVHFDFGANLRATSEQGYASFTERELDVIRDSLTSGALLENEHFPIAEKILRSFLRQKNVQKTDLLILNGLPRHTGQAERIDGIVRIRWVVSLECTAETVFERIRRDTGGDRRGRTDDALETISNKLTLFRERTAPLIHHYRSKNAALFRIQVTRHSTAHDMHVRLESRGTQSGHKRTLP